MLVAVEHEFRPDDVSLLDLSIFDFTRIHGPRQLTDLYLLALASAREGQLVTFDQRIPLAAVPPAEQKNISVIGDWGLGCQKDDCLARAS